MLEMTQNISYLLFLANSAVICYTVVILKEWLRHCCSCHYFLSRKAKYVSVQPGDLQVRGTYFQVGGTYFQVGGTLLQVGKISEMGGILGKI